MDKEPIYGLKYNNYGTIWTLLVQTLIKMKDCHHMHPTSEIFESIQLLIIMHSSYCEGLTTINIFTTKEIGPNK